MWGIFFGGVAQADTESTRIAQINLWIVWYGVDMVWWIGSDLRLCDLGSPDSRRALSLFEINGYSFIGKGLKMRAVFAHTAVSVRNARGS